MRLAPVIRTSFILGFAALPVRVEPFTHLRIYVSLTICAYLRTSVSLYLPISLAPYVLAYFLYASVPLVRPS